MTDTDHRPGGADAGAEASAPAVRRNHVGPLGPGNGPVLASGLVFGAAVLFAGYGMAQAVSTDEAPAQAARETITVGELEPGDEDGVTITVPDGDDEVSVTFQDKDGDGVPDAFEKGGTGRDGTAPRPGEQDEDAGTSTDSGDSQTKGPADDATPKAESEAGSDAAGKPRPVPEQEPKAEVYVIRPGDTLAEISGETGVPVGLLVEENRIQDPNLIYAGASLLIPPV